ncbi:MAG: glycogen/starch/alpha-glucan phosphorylase [Burkholderiales bacterium]
MTISAKTDLFEYHYLGVDVESLKRSVARRLMYSIGKDPHTTQDRDWVAALSLVVRDRLVEQWVETTRSQSGQDVKRVYYLSMEFLVGRALSNNLHCIGLYDDCKTALSDLGLDLEEILSIEPDAALGNGGLGRLAACFLDSMATLGLPGYGYGIRYEYGMFAQRLREGHQVEAPDHWLKNENPWEFPRSEVSYTVQYGGLVEHKDGVANWISTDDVQAMAYDTIIPGYRTQAVSTLRLWSARATEEIELAIFNEGDYDRAVEVKNRSENVSRVLYPDDSTPSGRELRLRQEYFFVCASLQDILNQHLRDHGSLDNLAGKVAIHLNDTHPAIAIPELMRLLIDVHRLPWEKAWSLTTRIFSYTNHTLMPEALEIWPVVLLRTVLPRHLEIIFDINKRFLDAVKQAHGEDPALIGRVSLIDEWGERRVRMANLSIVGSHKVNGVSKLHSRLMRETIFADFARIYPDRFINITNGITPRRWLSQANPWLAQLVDAVIGNGWRTNLEQLTRLEPLVGDPQFVRRFLAIKTQNKARLAGYIAKETRITVDHDSLFDVQAKRIHEYKRQLLNVLHVVTRYNAIRRSPGAGWVPRTVIFSGKAASSYWMAKLIIKLINDVAHTLNRDPATRQLLQVVFVPNYGVSVAEIIIPAADLSQQISTAGSEASGTGNMKLALNGALTIGTEDGANIEIREAVGSDNIFMFGHSAAQVAALRSGGYDPARYYETDPRLKEVLDQISSGFFSPDEPARFRPMVDALLRHGDHYLLLADYASYVDTHNRADALFAQPEEWGRRAALNVAAMGRFSSDRAVREYAETVWGVQPIRFGTAMR